MPFRICRNIFEAVPHEGSLLLDHYIPDIYCVGICNRYGYKSGKRDDGYIACSLRGHRHDYNMRQRRGVDGNLCQ